MAVVRRGALEVEFYKPPGPTDPAPVEPTSGPPSAPRNSSGNIGARASRSVVAAAGGLLSLLLHALFIASITLGGSFARVHPPTPHVPYAVGASDGAESTYTMELEVLDDVDAGSPSDEVAFSAPTLISITPTDALASPAVPIPFIQDESQRSLETEAAERFTLVGRYLGQIDARIERAWQRPRSPIEEGLFTCRVRIEQSPHGDVREITLERCNGDARWQLSLVHAIQFASPLPAPPDPAVFKPVIHMKFRSEPYTAQAEQGAYESTGPQSSDGAETRLR